MTDHADAIMQAIQRRRERATLPSGTPLDLLREAHAQKLAHAFNCPLREIYRVALAGRVIPCRYIRNLESISLEEQAALIESAVAVIGAGGLGGYLVQLLARVGIGRLVVVDCDILEESNLNRQLLATCATLGLSKAEAAVDLAGQINPAVETEAYNRKIDLPGLAQILADVDVAVDALDSVADRLLLAEAARRRGIPMVHGAVAGFEGQVMTIFPEDPGFAHVYGRDGAHGNGGGNGSLGTGEEVTAEGLLGVPAPAPSIVASLQAMEVLKLVLKRGRLIRDHMVHIDLENGTMHEFSFAK